MIALGFYQTLTRSANPLGFTGEVEYGNYPVAVGCREGLKLQIDEGVDRDEFN